MAPTISPAAIKQALAHAGGSVTGAARTLGIASASLRRLVRAHPMLADTVLEQIEQEIDVAHQVLWDGLDSDSAMTRMRAADTQALMWSSLAVAGAEDDATRQLAVTVRDALAAKMTPAQIAEAQRLARQRFPK
jgi:plasmid maintenance system antidote protein VapI